MNVDEVRTILVADRQALVASSMEPPPARRCAMNPHDFAELRMSMTEAVVLDSVEIVKGAPVAQFMGVEIYTDSRVPRGIVAFDVSPPRR